MDLLNQITKQFNNHPSDLVTLEKLLSSREFTKDELASLAIDFASNCFCEYRDALNPEIPSISLENMHSNHIVDAIILLLKLGLNPNIVINDENIMWETQYIDAPNIAPAVLQLLLEYGGNPNLSIDHDGESLFQYIDFKVYSDIYSNKERHLVQCWLLLIAYGANIKAIPFKLLEHNTVDIFKNYQSFDYTIETLPPKQGANDCRVMHIFNIDTQKEVAIYNL